jgi:hypothetical protein
VGRPGVGVWEGLGLLGVRVGTGRCLVAVGVARAGVFSRDAVARGAGEPAGVAARVGAGGATAVMVGATCVGLGDGVRVGTGTAVL